jgi:hypothetical protein
MLLTLILLFQFFIWPLQCISHPLDSETGEQNRINEQKDSKKDKDTAKKTQSVQKYHTLIKEAKPKNRKNNAIKELKPQRQKKKKLPHQKKQSKPRPLIIENNINNQMISYRHWTGTYTPEFSLKVNNIIIPAQGSTEVLIEKSECIVAYDAHFPLDNRSQEAFSVKLKDDTKKIGITFDWEKKPRIHIVEEKY